MKKFQYLLYSIIICTELSFKSLNYFLLLNLCMVDFSFYYYSVLQYPELLIYAFFCDWSLVRLFTFFFCRHFFSSMAAVCHPGFREKQLRFGEFAYLPDLLLHPISYLCKERKFVACKHVHRQNLRTSWVIDANASWNSFIYRSRVIDFACIIKMRIIERYRKYPFIFQLLMYYLFKKIMTKIFTYLPNSENETSLLQVQATSPT